MAIPKERPTGDDPPEKQPARIEPVYVTRDEFEARMASLQAALTQHIDDKTKDLRQMLRQSINAGKQQITANEQQRDLFSTMMRGIETTVKETFESRASEIKSIQADVDALQLQSVDTRVQLATLTSETRTMAENVNAFIKKADERDATAVKRMAQIEGRIEENWTWIEQKRKLEARVRALARPVTKLPRGLQIAAIIVAAGGGGQLEFGWINWLLEMLP